MHHTAQHYKYNGFNKIYDLKPRFTLENKNKKPKIKGELIPWIKTINI